MSAQLDDDALTVERLLADARALGGGLEDFGEGFHENLSALSDMYRTTARLSEHGRRSTHRRLVGLLVNRLKIQAAFAANPGLRARPLTKPLYVVGLPRTGTSALFNLLARDRTSRPLLYWEGLHPDPLPLAEPSAVDPRLEQTRKQVARALAKNPGFAAMHRVEADAPEECVALLAHTLGSVQMGIEPLIAGYREYFRSQDQRANYRYYVDLLRLLDAQRPGARWLLKSPAHLWGLGALFTCLPDACVVWTHRDPVAVVGSYCSMVEALSVLREGVDLHELGRDVLEYLASSLERAQCERSALDPQRFFDVRHADAVSDPLGVVRRIYAQFGFSLDPDDLERMRAHATARPEPAAGAHRYTLERYGLSEAQVAERFSEYSRRLQLIS